MAYWLVCSKGAGDGSRNADFWLEQLAEQGVEGVTVCPLEDSTRWIERIGADDCLLAAGGDGTVNAVASLCLQTGATLGVLPSGTANDFARNLGLSDDPAEAAQLVARGESRKLDVADFDDGIFLNVAHIGLGTLPSRKASAPAKKFLGKFSYMATLLQKLGANRGFRARIETDQGEFRGRWLSIAVATGAYFGGGQEIPEASANDGQLDVIGIRPRPLTELMLTFLKVRFNGNTRCTDNTVVQVKGRWCRVHTSRPRTVTVDGDVAGKTPFKASCQPGVIRVFCRTVVDTGRA